MARPRLIIDTDQVQKLASIHCTTPEIASIVGCSVDTLERRFAATIEKGRNAGKASLRRQQWALAQAGNPTMCIWLGKQMLGQKDRQEVSTDPAAPFNMNATINVSKLSIEAMAEIMAARDALKNGQ